MTPRPPCKGRQPVQVEPCCSLVSKHSERGALLPEAPSFDGKFAAVGAPSTERGGPAQAYGRFAEIAPEEAGKAAEERTAEQAHEASTSVVFAGGSTSA